MTARRSPMTIENASFRAVLKPWGRKDLRPWNRDDHGGANVGEVWFGRAGSEVDGYRLLLKILFTSEPLSIQVHPDDTQAQAAGEANGKTEAWYVLAADPYARVGLGPKRTMTAADLRASVDEGRVPDIVQWLPAVARDVFVVPAGTIHAIGPGLVIVEIQQRSDLTYRLFDHGRSRGLQVEEALSIASRSPVAASVAAIRVSEGRSAIAVTPFFVLERLALIAGSAWQVDAQQETWALVLEGEIEIAGACRSLK
jgi:mannose-6-phosphate isomerase